MTHFSSSALLSRNRLLFGVFFAIAAFNCSDGTPQFVLSPPPSSSNSPSLFAGSGGEAGAPTGGSTGYGGTAGETITGGKAGTGAVGGFAGGAAGKEGSCPLSGPGQLTNCKTASLGSCTGCLCASPQCADAWNTCQKDSRCEQAAQCLVLGCPSSYCASLAGSAQIQLIPLLNCFALDCAQTCSGVSEQAGQGGNEAGGDAGQSGQSGEAGQGGNTTAGAGGNTTAGTGGNATAGEGGDAGEGGQAGEAGETGQASGAGNAQDAGSAGEEASAGKTGLTPQSVDCNAPLTSPSKGDCISGGTEVNCNPITGIPCSSELQKVCSWGASDSPQTLACVPQTSGAPLCGVCDEITPCKAGLACYQGQCAKVCCSEGDCGPSAICTLVAFGAGVCLAPS